MRRLLGFGIVLVGFTVCLTPARAAMFPKTYQVFCRGKLSAGARTSLGTLLVKGKRHSGAAGNKGANLPAGACAWKDRALNSDENPGIHFTKQLLETNPAFAPLVLTCAHDSDCIIEAYVSRNSFGNLTTTNPTLGVDTHQK